MYYFTLPTNVIQSYVKIKIQETEVGSIGIYSYDE